MPVFVSNLRERFSAFCQSKLKVFAAVLVSASIAVGFNYSRIRDQLFTATIWAVMYSNSAGDILASGESYYYEDGFETYKIGWSKREVMEEIVRIYDRTAIYELSKNSNPTNPKEDGVLASILLEDQRLLDAHDAWMHKAYDGNAPCYRIFYFSDDKLILIKYIRSYELDGPKEVNSYHTLDWPSGLSIWVHRRSSASLPGVNVSNFLNREPPPTPGPTFVSPLNPKASH